MRGDSVAGIEEFTVELAPPARAVEEGYDRMSDKAIWDSFCDEPFELPSDKPLTVAANFAGIPKKAYVEPVAVGDPLPSLPLFLDPYIYVPAPLESTYETTWQKCPAVVRELVAGPVPYQG